MENSAFLGKGWAFPPVFEDGGKTVKMVSGEKDIEESLMILFTTRYRERVLHHSFGADFDAFIFEDIDQNLFSNIRKMISDAITKYEPRILLERVEFVDDPGDDEVIHVEVEFTIKSTNARHNLVFPFNLAEGSLYHKIVGA
jgi:phage baseplate assembly protein W